MYRLALVMFVLGAGPAVFAQEYKPNSVSNSYKARIFITDSKSWEVSGGFGGTDAGFGGGQNGGARPQTGEIIKTFGQRCPDIIVNNRQEKADYVVLLDHEGGKAIFLHDNKVAVFNHEGDSILSHSTRSLGNAVKDACDAIVNDWRVHGAVIRASQAAQQSNAPTGTLVAAAESKRISHMSLSSNPVSADIEVDGAFVGNTPSTIEVTPGDHSIVIFKAGYQRWEKKIKVTGGSVNISADLVPEKN